MKTSIWIAVALLTSVAAAAGETLYTVTPLGALPGATFTIASAINNSGQVTGSSGISEGQNNAFLYSNGIMTDLGGLPGFGANPGRAINDSGEIAGSGFNGDGGGQAFVYSGGALTAIGTLPGRHIARASASTMWGRLSANHTRYPAGATRFSTAAACSRI